MYQISHLIELSNCLSKRGPTVLMSAFHHSRLLAKRLLSTHSCHQRCSIDWVSIDCYWNVFGV